jgi:hypothetical protein
MPSPASIAFRILLSEALMIFFLVVDLAMVLSLSQKE